MSKAKLGTKRACSSCGMRYYDLNKSPIICPKCSTEFDPESAVKSRKSRSATKAANDDEEISDDETMAFDDGSQDQSGKKTAPMEDDVDDDLDYDDDDSDVDDESGGLIRDDISADDELLSNIRDEDDD